MTLGKRAEKLASLTVIPMTLWGKKKKRQEIPLSAREICESNPSISELRTFAEQGEAFCASRFEQRAYFKRSRASIE